MQSNLATVGSRKVHWSGSEWCAGCIVQVHPNASCMVGVTPFNTLAHTHSILILQAKKAPADATDGIWKTEQQACSERIECFAHFGTGVYYACVKVLLWAALPDNDTA